ncbi:Crp/Fnr family transcriptional regulator [Leuconostoc palmae]|uniref:Crp/Fnr family transcriptional regulator n=1 Tax=Leuconostoc palmae TaxID=501487 RepID=UPI001C7D3C0D|nr:Crp/Fnr family transcriptional regulator [Leuconostoc palmae]
MSHNSFACVKAAPIFSYLPDDIISQLANISTHQKFYPAGSYIYRPNDELSALFVVDSGQVDIFSSNEDGQELLLYSLIQNQMDVEAALFTDEKHHHFARAKSNSKICFIRRHDFQTLLKNHPTLAIQMLNSYGKRLTELEQKQINLSLKTAEERLIDYFKQQSEKTKSKKIKLHMTKKELAKSLHMTPETLSRIFNKLILTNIILVHNREITIL